MDSTEGWHRNIGQNECSNLLTDFRCGLGRQLLDCQQCDGQLSKLGLLLHEHITQNGFIHCDVFLVG